MNIQDIIISAQSIEFDRRRVVGQTVSRSERLRTAERASATAFKFRVSPPARLRFSTNRDLVEGIAYYDRSQEQIIGFSGNLSYITQYQGECTQAQLDAMTITNFVTATITIGNLTSTSSSVLLFKAGDWIQPETSRYPYIVTTDVQRGSTSTVQVSVHRSLIPDVDPLVNVQGPILVGTQTSLRVVVTELPTYKLVQRDWFEFSGDFVLVEYII